MAIAENIKKLPKNTRDIILIPLDPYNNRFDLCYTTFKDDARHPLHDNLSRKDAQETALRYASIIGII